MPWTTELAEQLGATHRRLKFGRRASASGPQATAPGAVGRPSAGSRRLFRRAPDVADLAVINAARIDAGPGDGEQPERERVSETRHPIPSLAPVMLKEHLIADVERLAPELDAFLGVLIVHRSWLLAQFLS